MFGRVGWAERKTTTNLGFLRLSRRIGEGLRARRGGGGLTLGLLLRGAGDGERRLRAGGDGDRRVFLGDCEERLLLFDKKDDKQVQTTFRATLNGLQRACFETSSLRHCKRPSAPPHHVTTYHPSCDQVKSGGSCMSRR